VNFAGERSQLAGGGEVGAGPGPGCGADGEGLVLGGQKGGGSRHGSVGTPNGGGGAVVVGTGNVVVGVGGAVVVGVGVTVTVGGCCTRLRGTQV